MSLLRFLPTAELPLGYRILGFGHRGRDVADLQRALREAGHLLPVDGVYGYATETAVRRLQAQLGLSVDGRVGPATLAALRELRSARYIICRVRPGDTTRKLATAFGLTEEAFRRHNGLSRHEPLNPGRLVVVPRRAILLLPDERPPASLRYTLALGPVLQFSPPEKIKARPDSPGRVPLLLTEEADWERLGKEDAARREFMAWVSSYTRKGETQAFVVALPSSFCLSPPRGLWWFLTHLQGKLRLPLGLLLSPEADAWASLLRSSPHFYIFLDPGSKVYDMRVLAPLLRRWRAIFPADRLLLVLRGGALHCREGEEERLSFLLGRAMALAARARPIWEEEAGVYRAILPREGEKNEGLLFLLEERGLRRRIRLADRYGLAGVVLGGLRGLALNTPWPGEFSVLDSFPFPAHID